MPHPVHRRRARAARLLLALLLALAAPAGAAAQQAPAADDRELVVLVHGMGRTPVSMLPLEWALEREGYRVMNWGYSSTCCTVDELGRGLLADVDARRRGAPRVHFVGHSLGNIIVRWVLAQEGAPPNVGRVVMLAPPNRGSHEADRLSPSLGWLLRPLPELRTDSASTARTLLPRAGVELGVIAGRDDGKVSVAETHLAGQADHVVVPSAHTFIMLRGDVRRLVLAFLRHGTFDAVSGAEPGTGAEPAPSAAPAP